MEKKKYNALQEDIYEQAYAQVENMIYDICWRFQKQYGGDMIDWEGHAHEIFMKCMKDYKSSRSQFSSWMWKQMHWGFLSLIRTEYKKRKKINITHSVDVLEEILVYEKPMSSLTVLIELASQPVKELFEIITFPPPELTGELNAEDPLSAWDAVQRFCRHHLKWSEEQIQEVEAELKVLCNQ